MSARAMRKRAPRPRQACGTSSVPASSGDYGARVACSPAGPRSPYIPPDEFRSYLKFSNPTAPLLGDANDWDDLDRSQSIIVGGPDTVYQRILDIVEHAKCGHLLIQCHMGNMPDALVRN